MLPGATPSPACDFSFFTQADATISQKHSGSPGSLVSVRSVISFQYFHHFHYPVSILSQFHMSEHSHVPRARRSSFNLMQNLIGGLHNNLSDVLTSIIIKLVYGVTRRSQIKWKFSHAGTCTRKQCKLYAWKKISDKVDRWICTAQIKTHLPPTISVWGNTIMTVE